MVELTPEQVPAAGQKALSHGYLKRTLTGIDQFVNVLTGGNPGETMSARSQRAASKGHWVGRAMVWWLNKLQPDHGARAEAGDLARSERVEELEQKDLGVNDG